MNTISDRETILSFSLSELLWFPQAAPRISSKSINGWFLSYTAQAAEPALLSIDEEFPQLKHTRARLSCTGWKSTCNKPMYFICQGTYVWWGWVYKCICFSMYLMGEEKEREGVRPTMKFSTPFHWKVGQTMLINWIWGARCSLQPWLLCSDRFCYLGWVNVSCINQCKGCILILEPSSGCVIGTRLLVLLGYLIKCEWQVTVRLPRGANLFGYSLFFFLIWLLCVKDGWRFRLVLYIHIFHQWLHTEEYNEIFVANL